MYLLAHLNHDLYFSIYWLNESWKTPVKIKENIKNFLVNKIKLLPKKKDYH